jgi:ABC-type glycerol-3-phosphate transport system permease component
MVIVRLFKFLAYAAVIFWSLLVLLPFIFVSLFGLKSNTAIFSNPLGLFDFVPQWQNYVTAWNAGPNSSATIGVFFLNSAIIAITALITSLSISVPAAYFTSFLTRAWNQRILLLVIVGTVVPIIMLVIPYFRAFNALSLLNNPVATGVVYGALNIPTAFLLMNRFFIDFPREVLEAGMLDGLGPFRTFIRLVLPLSKGQIVAVSVLNLIFAWTDYQISIVLLTKRDAQPISVGLLSFIGDFSADYGPMFAGLTLASLPVLILYVFFSRYVTKGIALGGISK